MRRVRPNENSWLPRSHVIDQPTSSVSLLTLNDDCLEMIFMQRAIGFVELSKLSYVCRRFNNIIARMPRNCHVPYWQYAQIPNKSIWKTYAMLSALGPTIRFASIYSKSETIFEMLFEYCRYIQYFEVCSHQPPINYILKEGKINVIPNMRFVHYSQHVIMSRYTIPTDLPKMMYASRPSIVELNLYGIDSIDLSSFSSFLKANAALKQVNFVAVSKNLLLCTESIIDSFPNEIRKLTITREKYLNSTLQIRQYLDRPRAPEIRYKLRNMIHLPRLKLFKNNQIDTSQMLSIAQYLPYLEELSITSDDLTYDGIWNTINEATHLKKATFTTWSRDYADDNLARIRQLREERGIQLEVFIRCVMPNVVSNLNFV